jgi:hypothetical protein
MKKKSLHFYLSFSIGLISSIFFAVYESLICLMWFDLIKVLYIWFLHNILFKNLKSILPLKELKMITKDEQSKLRSTIALLSSMVNGGEQHSEQSRKEMNEALSIVNNLPIQNVSHQRELLLAYENYTSKMITGKTNDRTAKSLVNDFLANNCG